MKTKISTLGLAALLPVAILTFSSCTTEHQVTKGPDVIAFQTGVPGGVMVNTYKETATVTAIDPATHKVTLVTKDGTQTTVKAGPEVANFAQIEVGDQVKATVTDKLLIFVPKPGELAVDQAASAVALAPLGEKPGGTMAETTQFTTKVTAVDLKHHTATLQLPDGTSKTFNVRPDVELTKETVGVDVVIRTTQAVAISVEKP